MSDCAIEIRSGGNVFCKAIELLQKILEPGSRRKKGTSVSHLSAWVVMPFRRKSRCDKTIWDNCHATQLVMLEIIPKQDLPPNSLAFFGKAVCLRTKAIARVESVCFGRIGERREFLASLML